MLSLFTLYLHYAYQCSASRLLPAVASLAWDAWPPLVLLAAASTGTSAISHSWAVSVMGVVYSLHMLPIGGLSRASTTSDSDPCIVEYTTVVLTLLLCVFAWIAAQHFSLALLVYVVVMPSLALVCRLCPTVKSQTNIGITGNRVLELLSVVWSPCGVYLLLYWFENTIAMSHESLIARLLLDWRKVSLFCVPSRYSNCPVVWFVCSSLRSLGYLAGEQPGQQSPTAQTKQRYNCYFNVVRYKVQPLQCLSPLTNYISVNTSLRLLCNTATTLRFSCLSAVPAAAAPSTGCRSALAPLLTGGGAETQSGSIGA